MRVNVNHRNTNFYWNQVKDLSPEDKLDLISRLSRSIILNVDCPRKNTLNECFAAWSTSDDDYSDEMLLHDIDKACSEKDDFIKEFI